MGIFLNTFSLESDISSFHCIYPPYFEKFVGLDIILKNLKPKEKA